MPTLTTLFNIGLEDRATAIRQSKERYPNWKRRGKLTLYAEDMILYIRNPEDSTGFLTQTDQRIQQSSRIQD